MEIERWCRKNGLPIRGHREVMVSQLFILEEAKKHKNQDEDEDVRYGYKFSIRGKKARETNTY